MAARKSNTATIDGKRMREKNREFDIMFSMFYSKYGVISFRVVSNIMKPLILLPRVMAGHSTILGFIFNLTLLNVDDDQNNRLTTVGPSG